MEKDIKEIIKLLKGIFYMICLIAGLIIGSFI